MRARKDDSVMPSGWVEIRLEMELHGISFRTRVSDLRNYMIRVEGFGVVDIYLSNPSQSVNLWILDCSVESKRKIFDFLGSGTSAGL